MDVPENLLMPNGHPWSTSAADAYDRCPLAFSMRYGAHRITLTTPTHGDVAQRRGRVLHAALAVALEHAQIELRRNRAPIPGKLRRYYGPARRALGQAWVDEGMPSDSAEAARVVDMFERALDEVDIPLPGALHGIEERREHITRGGIPVVFIPDVTWWVVRERGVLRVRDWKSGKISEDDVPRHQQLLRYAGWLIEADPTITDVEIELYSLREAKGYVVRADPAMVTRATARFDRIVGRALADREMAPKVGPHCSGCWFQTQCPAFTAQDEGEAA